MTQSLRHLSCRNLILHTHAELNVKECVSVSMYQCVCVCVCTPIFYNAKSYSIKLCTYIPTPFLGRKANTLLSFLLSLFSGAKKGTTNTGQMFCVYSMCILYRDLVPTVQ